MNSIVSDKAIIREMEADELLSMFNERKKDYDFAMDKCDETKHDYSDWDAYYIYAPDLLMIERNIPPIINQYRQITGITLEL